MKSSSSDSTEEPPKHEDFCSSELSRIQCASGLRGIAKLSLGNPSSGGERGSSKTRSSIQRFSQVTNASIDRESGETGNEHQFHRSAVEFHLRRTDVLGFEHPLPRLLESFGSFIVLSLVRSRKDGTKKTYALWKIAESTKLLFSVLIRTENLTGEQRSVVLDVLNLFPESISPAREAVANALRKPLDPAD